MVNEQLGETSGVVVEAVAVPMYREPLSGRRFKSEVQAIKHGVKMQRAAVNEGFSERKSEAWAAVSTAESFLETLKLAVGWQVEEWELLHKRKKAYPLKPEWKQGEVTKWKLNKGEFLEAEVEFQVWLDPQMYGGVYAALDRDSVVGSRRGRGREEEVGQWAVVCRSVVDGKALRMYMQCSLSVLLPVRKYPQLFARIQKDVEAVCAERDREELLEEEVERAAYKDMRLRDAKGALEEAQRVVRCCEEAVRERLAALALQVRMDPEAEKRWEACAANASLPAGEMKRLLELDRDDPDYVFELYPD